MAELPLLSDDAAAALLSDVAEVQRGESWVEGQERWRTDPDAATTWPELALAIYQYQLRTVGRERAVGFRDALRAIEVSDYRARRELAAALAIGHHEGVENWAIAELARPLPAQPLPSDAEDPDLVPLHVLVWSYGRDRDAALTRAFCEGGARRRNVIEALGRWGDAMDRDLFQAMAGTSGLSQEEKNAVIRASIRLAAREMEQPRFSPLFQPPVDELLPVRLSRGQPVDGPPLSCPAKR